MNAPTLDGETAEIEVVVQGHFVADDPVDQDLYDAFVAFTPLVQLWPFARGYVAQIASMLNVNLQLLPLLDVRRDAPAELSEGTAEGEP